MLGHGAGIGYTGPGPRMGPIDNFSLVRGADNINVRSPAPFLLSYRIYSRISRQFMAQFLRSSCGGRLMRGSCHTHRVDSQHNGCLSATLTVYVPHTAWTNSRSLGLRGCMGESTSAEF